MFQPRNGRYSRVGGSGANSMFSPEYDDPANMGDEYGSQYGQYGAPYEQYESRQSMAGRSIGTVSIIHPFDWITPGEIN